MQRATGFTYNETLLFSYRGFHEPNLKRFQAKPPTPLSLKDLYLICPVNKEQETYIEILLNMLKEDIHVFISLVPL
jgi:hypothetical protein